MKNAMFTGVKHEVFVGSETGGVDVTMLIAFLEGNNTQPQINAFTKPNLQGMIDHHEWDASLDQRIKDLRRLRRKWRPLIVVKNAEANSVYVIDGWHRLYILNEDNKRNDFENVPFLTWVVSMRTLAMFPIPTNGVLRDFA